MKKKAFLVYIILFLVICLIPSGGLLLGGSEESSENRRLAEAPVLRTEEGWNQDFLGDAGAYFEDHFAFRNEWVTGYALLSGKLFGTSSQNSVIVGENDWLYYKDSLGDYQGSEQMTERQLFDAAHTLAMIQDYAAENGLAFVFTIAPNKNSLYGEDMPYYYRNFRTEENNYSRILPWLESEQVNYVDLYGPLKAQGEVLYHTGDSHWNNKGAAMAADLILSALGREHPSYADREYEVRKDFEGDLDQMLYPAAVTPEDEIYYEPMPQFGYVEEVESNFSPKISTWGASDSGSLVMYRDSFGNALLPFMAESFRDAYFTRGVPYQISDIFAYEADTVVIERAERFLPEMIHDAPVMMAPIISYEALEGMEFTEEIPELKAEEQGIYTKLTGTLDEGSYDVDSRIYIRVNGVLSYEAFPVSDENGQEGFQAFLLTELLEEEGNKYEVGISRCCS